MASDIIDSDIITNESFLKAYDNLKLSIINQKRKTKKISWEQLLQIFTDLKVDLCDVPTDKVRVQIKGLMHQSGI